MVGAAVAAVGTVALAAVTAASLGSLGASSLLALDQSSSVPAPTVIGCDNFTGTTGASMNGRAAQVPASCAGRTWTAHVGTWTIQTNRGASTTTANAAATLNTASASATVSATVISINATGRTGGVILSHNGTSTYLAAVMVAGAPNRLELRIVITGTSTVLATVNPTYGASHLLLMTRAAALVTVSLDGTQLISHTLSAARQTSLGTGGRAGLFGGNTNVRFDDLLVTTP